MRAAAFASTATLIVLLDYFCSPSSFRSRIPFKTIACAVLAFPGHCLSFCTIKPPSLVFVGSPLSCSALLHFSSSPLLLFSSCCSSASVPAALHSSPSQSIVFLSLFSFHCSATLQSASAIATSPGSQCSSPRFCSLISLLRSCLDSCF